jgi:hypothetical protein
MDRPPDSMILSETPSLSFVKGRMTTGTYRRMSKPHLICMGGNGSAKDHIIHTILCKNVRGSWSCDSQELVPHFLILGKTHIECDNYGNMLSPYVRKDSCVVEYTLDYLDNDTMCPISWGGAGGEGEEEGEEKQLEGLTYDDYNSWDQIAVFLIMLLLLGFLLTIVIQLYIKVNVPQEVVEQKRGRRPLYTSNTPPSNRKEKRREQRGR